MPRKNSEPRESTRFTPQHVCSSLLYASKDRSVTNEAVKAFIAHIQQAVADGCGFLPLIGAGFSVPSGTPLIIELRSYLQRCIAMALGVEPQPAAIGKPMRPWNPRSDKWPPLADRQRNGHKNWTAEVESAQERRTSEDRLVFREAVGAMAEWRSSLVFLSRVISKTRLINGQTRQVILLEAPLQRVIDNCLREVMDGWEPALNHRMLAGLAGLLRLNVVITTNFDDLLEQAFSDARNPLWPSDLQLNSSFPPWWALSNQRSIIKIHGGRHSLRADYSLDAQPSISDCVSFLDYLLSADGRQLWATPSQMAQLPKGGLPFQNHLLMMGFSASEQRTRSLVEYAWAHLDQSKFKVMWLCHTPNDVDRVIEFTEECKRNHKFPGSWAGSHILRQPNLGLFFLQLYQTLRRVVPTQGIVFPSVARVALPPMPSRHDKRLPRAKKSIDHTRIADRISDLLNAEDRHRLLVVTSNQDEHGVTSACGRAFDLLLADKACIWLDMSDVSDADDFFEKLLDAVYYRVGKENWMPVNVTVDPHARAEEIRRHAQTIPMQWVIFINARETPGANHAESDDSDTAAPGNGWLDAPSAPCAADEGQAKKYEKLIGNRDEFIRLLDDLSGPGESASALAVTLMLRNAPENAVSILSKLEIEHLVVVDDVIKVDAVQFDEHAILRNSVLWTQGEKRRRRFLQTLVLMQRPRYLATIWSDAVALTRKDEGNKEPPIGPDDADAWVGQLEEIGLLRWKPGGFIWLHAFTRQRLRYFMRTDNAFDDFPLADGAFKDCVQDWKPHKDASEIHCSLATWYARILTASEAPASLFEAVYHACRAAHGMIQHDGKYDDAADKLEWASALLHGHSFLIQTQGYSRGSCRHLEQIGRWCELISMFGPAAVRSKKAANFLHVRCLEVMRAIAREVGEDKKAYERHCQVRAILAGKDVKEANGIHNKQLFERFFGRTEMGSVEVSTKASAEEPTLFDEGIEWIRWLRWGAMLAIASRSYNGAYAALSRVLKSFGTPEYETDLPTPQALDVLDRMKECLRTCMKHDSLTIHGARVADQQQLRLEFVRVVEQIVYVRLLEHSLARRLNRLLHNVASADTPNIKGAARLTVLCDDGIRLADQILAHDHSSDTHFYAPVAWCKSRLSMHMSLAAIYDEDRIHSEETWRIAMRHLVEAEASLAAIDNRRYDTDRAILDLYRAEIRIKEAESRSLKVNDPRHQLFGDLPLLFGSLPYPQSRAQMAELRASLFTNIGPSEFQQAKATVNDAMTFLNRAERVLRGRRRNVSWTSWFIERKLRAVALSIWATLLEKATPVPFLGLESSPRHADTLADTLLQDALRMIRLDAYRLATIIDAYAECANALRMRLAFDPTTAQLSQRQRQMYLRLNEALVRLDEVRAKRADTQSARDVRPTTDGKINDDPRKRRASLSVHVNTYIGCVVAHTRGILKHLEFPLI